MNGNAFDWFVERHLRDGSGDKIAYREAWQDGRELGYTALAQQSSGTIL